jgi:hypothetical protein
MMFDLRFLMDIDWRSLIATIEGRRSHAQGGQR